MYSDLMVSFFFCFYFSFFFFCRIDKYPTSGFVLLFFFSSFTIYGRIIFCEETVLQKKRGWRATCQFVDTFFFFSSAVGVGAMGRRDVDKMTYQERIKREELSNSIEAGGKKKKWCGASLDWFSLQLLHFSEGEKTHNFLFLLIGWYTQCFSNCFLIIMYSEYAIPFAIKKEKKKI